MLTTVAQANNKQCCRDRNKMCEANRCMAWRWWKGDGPKVQMADRQCAVSEEEAGERPARCEGWEFRPWPRGDGAHWLEPMESFLTHRRGFCGLAGTVPHDL